MSDLFPMPDIPGYRVLGPLGQGGMAQVLLAEQVSLQRKVALKLLLPGLAVDAEDRQRFLREARIAAQLHHPHIVAIHDVGQFGDQVFIAMAYEPGGTLAEQIRDGLPPERALRILRDIASALDFAHRNGVVHRDVKPENVLMREDGSCLLSDFGIAFSSASGRGLTREGVSLGTPAYMSPEQLRGEPVDARSDLYSLGVVLFQMLSGRVPYSGTDGWAIGLQHLHSSLPRLQGPAQALQGLLEGLMAKDPRERIGTAAELVRRIDLQLSGRGQQATLALGHARSRRLRLTAGGRRRAMAALLLGAVIGLGWLLGASTPPWSEPVQPVAEASIAVLPFLDLSASRDQTFLAEGISEELIDVLGRIPGLRVAGRTSAFSFRERGVDLGSIATQLRVAHVLEGSVRRSGNRLRVSTRLLNARNGFQLWSDTFDREIDDAFALQDEIAGEVVKALQLRLLAPVSATASRSATISTEAYRHYLLGREAMRRANAEDYVRAAQAFRQVIALAPGFAPAYAELCQAEVGSLQYLDGVSDPLAAQQRALEAAETALRLDPQLAQGHAARATLRFTLTWDWPGALADFEHALQLQPGDSESHRRYGLLLAVLGRVEDAIAASERAIALDPLSSSAWNNLGYLQSARGLRDAARTSLQQALRISPGRVSSLFNLGVNELLAGKPAAAEQAFLAIPAQQPFRVLGEALLAQEAGDQARAQRLLDQVQGLPGKSPFWIAAVLAHGGQHRSALGWLEQALEQRDYFLKQASFDPLLQELRGESEMQALLARLGLSPATGGS